MLSEQTYWHLDSGKLQYPAKMKRYQYIRIQNMAKYKPSKLLEFVKEGQKALQCLGLYKIFQMNYETLKSFLDAIYHLFN